MATKKKIIPISKAKGRVNIPRRVKFTGTDITLGSVHKKVIAATEDLIVAKEIGITKRSRDEMIACLTNCANGIAKVGNALKTPVFGRRWK